MRGILFKGTHILWLSCPHGPIPGIVELFWRRCPLPAQGTPSSRQGRHLTCSLKHAHDTPHQLMPQENNAAISVARGILVQKSNAKGC